MSSFATSLALAQAAYIDARCENKIFQHKQLAKLHDALQTDARRLLAALPSGSRYEAELEHCLKALRDAIATLPAKMAKAIVKEVSLKHVLPGASGEAQVESSAGVVVIVGNDAHPFASWVMPLAAAILAANPAVLVLDQTTYELVHPTIKRSLDRDAFPVTACGRQDLEEGIKKGGVIAGVIGADLTQTSIVVSTAPTPVIIDQSILPGGIPLHPVSGKGLPTPPAVRTAAYNVAQALRSAGRSAKHSNAITYPSYLVVHENVAELFKRELDAFLPAGVAVELQGTQDKAAVKNLMSNPGGYLDYIPLFSVTSIDYAIDWIQDDLELPPAVFVFASAEFGKYVFRSLKRVKNVVVNDIPEKFIVCGPYHDYRDFRITARRHLALQSQPTEPSTVATTLTAAKVRALTQKVGTRIDFFGGSFMLTAGVFVSTVLGAFGYGAVKGGLFLYHHYL